MEQQKPNVIPRKLGCALFLAPEVGRPAGNVCQGIFFPLCGESENKTNLLASDKLSCHHD